ncbi:MAG TPA: putative LPS assembly protein LptD [Bryobacteraceae bacterium]|nr:putative LPS assembly protein LptD [Bryobacteraceae bacterium]
MPQSAGTTDPNVRIKPARPDAPGPSWMNVSSVTQESTGPVIKLRGKARVEIQEALLEADEVDYNTETGDAEARGHVHFQHFESNEELWCERAEYNIGKETGKFYKVRGSSPAKIDPRPGVLTTTNPFVFQGDWAERLKGRYILYNGFVTNCRIERPIWTLRAPKFDIIPGDRALAYKAWFKVRQFPLFYSPVFYKSLRRQPRKSGFLTPNIGNSSRRGYMVGAGYYWAINRSYDLSYRGQLFSQRGFAHTADFRGKPTQRSDFNFYLYGVNDRGLLLDDGSRRKEGGFIVSMDGRADLGRGFYARGLLNYLSSFRFRQAFTETFNEALVSEVQSVGVVTRHWSSFGLNLSFSRKENFQSPEEGDNIAIRRLPQVEFNSRDRLIHRKVLPVWVSLESTAGFLSRAQPLFRTRAFVQRADFEPRIMTAIRWKDFSILPSYAIRETYVGSRFNPTEQKVSGENIVRHARELGIDLVAPSFARIFNSPKWMGTKMKHVIESRASYHQVGGVDHFQNLIRFDETEVLSNTKEVEISVANRFYVKKASGEVVEAFSWLVTQKRYLDPTFGGALVGDQRNVLLSSAQLTGYAFFNGPRNYSPIISSLRVAPVGNAGIEWRTDYDPLFGRFTNSSINVSAHVSRYFVNLGHAYVKNDPRLSPPFNQFGGMFAIGNESRRGWNAAFSSYYDFEKGIMQYATTQVSYNLDCCGFSAQYRRFNFGTRNENQFRVAFAIANIGSFGTLKRQERIF